VTIFCLALLACTPDKNPTSFDVTQRTLILDYSYDGGVFTTVSERIRVMSSFWWTAENLNPKYVECNSLQGGAGVSYLDVKLTEQFAKDFAEHPELFPVETEGIFVGSILFTSSKGESIALKVYIGVQTLSVTFYANDGTGGSFTESYTIQKGESYPYSLPASDFFTAPESKTFCVWDKGENGSDVYFEAGATYDLTEDLELYAIWSGDGSNEANAFLIYNLSQLEQVRTHTIATQSKYYKLMADIDTETYIANPNGDGVVNPQKSWVPIGKSTAAPFIGHFNGNGYTISYGIQDISAIIPEQSDNNHYLGLFGVVGKGVGPTPGTIQNLNVCGKMELSINGTRTADYIGGVAGQLSAGSIQQITSHVVVIAVETGPTPAYVGGIVGYISQSTLSDATASGDISVACIMGLTDAYAGGAIGYMSCLYGEQITLRNIHTSGRITVQSAKNTYAGGVVGCITGASLSRASASGEIRAETIATSSASAYVGGIVGMVYSSTSQSLTGAYATGDVTAIAAGTASAYAGGIVGQSAMAMSNVYATGNVTAKAKATNKAPALAGGIVGSNSFTLTNAYATGNVTVSTAETGAYNVGAGGIVGYASYSSYLPKNCVALNQTVSASTATYAGRIWGYVSSGSGASNYAREDMEINNTSVSSSATAKHGADVEEADWKDNSSWWTTTGSWASAWNFDTIWTMGADGYPKFQWEVN